MRTAAVPLLLLLDACSKKPAPEDPAWRAGIEKFHQQRERIIGGDDGWITLAGRFPLRPGVNSVGSDPKSAAVFPADRAPAHAGDIVLEADQLYFMAADGADVRVKGTPIKTQQLADDSKGEPTTLELGSLRLFVIQRAGHFMLRARDLKHPARESFHGLTWYDADPKWRLKAKFEPSPPGTTVPIVNVLNMTEQQPSPGHVAFDVDGKTYRLVAVNEGSPDLFIIFKDATAGKGTYPSGRFVEAAPAGPDGLVDLDFNRAYTPPCGFTKFATCPLPPQENHLPIEIAAGETYAGSH
jgi:uncharacterized protein (DUF1684 family)